MCGMIETYTGSRFSSDEIEKSKFAYACLNMIQIHGVYKQCADLSETLNNLTEKSCKEIGEERCYDIFSRISSEISKKESKDRIKRIVIVIVAIAVVIALVVGISTSCSKSNESKSSSYEMSEQEKRILNTESALNIRVGLYCRVRYADVSTTDVIVSTLESNGDGTYSFYGYATILNKYGESYKGKLSGVVEEAADGTIDVVDYDLETPKRD